MTDDIKTLRKFVELNTEDIEALRKLVRVSAKLGYVNMFVNVNFLTKILAGKVPVGNNELPPEEVSKRLYASKDERDRLLQRLTCTCCGKSARSFGTHLGNGTWVCSAQCWFKAINKQDCDDKVVP